MDIDSFSGIPRIPFWALVKHDFKRRKRGRLQAYRGWWWVYALGVCAALLVLSSRLGQAALDLRFAWFAVFGLLFLSFGLGIGWTANEWRNGTVGWWLTLPVSRRRLMASKYVATLLRTLFVYAVVFLLISVFGVYTLAVAGQLHLHTLASFFGTGMAAYTLLVACSPLPAAMGVLYGVLMQSRLRPAVPLIWMAFGLLWWLLSIRGNHRPAAGSAHAGMLLNVWSLWSWQQIWAVLAMWLLAYVLVQAAAVVLDRYLAM
ncbi:MAG: ABC transporter permease [Alicyclobacillus sp.]|nr:ABC transporter permease [Alicyclobacillus sp.]